MANRTLTISDEEIEMQSTEEIQFLRSIDRSTIETEDIESLFEDTDEEIQSEPRTL